MAKSCRQNFYSFTTNKYSDVFQLNKVVLIIIGQNCSGKDQAISAPNFMRSRPRPRGQFYFSENLLLHQTRSSSTNFLIPNLLCLLRSPSNPIFNFLYSFPQKSHPLGHIKKFESARNLQLNDLSMFVIDSRK